MPAQALSSIPCSTSGSSAACLVSGPAALACLHASQTCGLAALVKYSQQLEQYSYYQPIILLKHANMLYLQRCLDLLPLADNSFTKALPLADAGRGPCNHVYHHHQGPDLACMHISLRLRYACDPLCMPAWSRMQHVTFMKQMKSFVMKFRLHRNAFGVISCT